MERINYFLIGCSTKSVICRKPPTLRVLMKNLLFEHLENNVKFDESVKLVIERATDLWEQFAVKSIRRDHLEEKLKAEYKKWQRLKWRKGQITKLYKDECKAFQVRLDQTFGLKRGFIRKIEKNSHDEGSESDAMQTQPIELPGVQQFDSLQPMENVSDSFSESQVQMLEDNEKCNLI